MITNSEKLELSFELMTILSFALCCIDIDEAYNAALKESEQLFGAVERDPDELRAYIRGIIKKWFDALKQSIIEDLTSALFH